MQNENNDLISREALKENIINICGKCSNIITKYENGIPDGNCAIQHIMNIIDNAPTVFSCNACKNMGNEQECVDCHDYSNYVHYDERPQGEWKQRFNKSKTGCTYICDKCGFETVILTNFCSFCGANMQKGGADNENRE